MLGGGRRAAAGARGADLLGPAALDRTRLPPDPVGEAVLLDSREGTAGSFCSLVNQGVFPHYMRGRGPFSMGDSERPKGVPEVPPEWAPFLLQKPVNGTITKTLSDFNAIMNLGARDGVRSGMEFLRKKWHPWTVKVLFTETDRCIIRIKTGKPGTIPTLRSNRATCTPGCGHSRWERSSRPDPRTRSRIAKRSIWQVLPSSLTTRSTAARRAPAESSRSNRLMGQSHSLPVGCGAYNLGRERSGPVSLRCAGSRGPRPRR